MIRSAVFHSSSSVLSKPPGFLNRTIQTAGVALTLGALGVIGMPVNAETPSATSAPKQAPVTQTITGSGNFAPVNSTTTIQNLPPAAPKPHYTLSAAVDYVTFETVAEKYNNRGPTIKTGGWRDSKSCSQSFTLPEGAFDVESNSFWNVGDKPHTNSVRREGNQIIASGTISSPSFDGQRVWGELFLEVKYKIKKPRKELSHEELPQLDMPQKEAVWTFDKGPMAHAVVQVMNEKGQVIGKAELTRSAVGSDVAVQTPPELGTVKFEFAKNTLRAVRVD